MVYFSLQRAASTRPARGGSRQLEVPRPGPPIPAAGPLPGAAPRSRGAALPPFLPPCRRSPGPRDGPVPPRQAGARAALGPARRGAAMGSAAQLPPPAPLGECEREAGAAAARYRRRPEEQVGARPWGVWEGGPRLRGCSRCRAATEKRRRFWFLSRGVPGTAHPCEPLPGNAPLRRGLCNLRGAAHAWCWGIPPVGPPEPRSSLRDASSAWGKMGADAQG